MMLDAVTIIREKQKALHLRDISDGNTGIHPIQQRKLFIKMLLYIPRDFSFNSLNFFFFFTITLITV